MQPQRIRKSESLFTREMRQLTSFIECFNEKKMIIQDSASLDNINQLFLESDFNFVNKQRSMHENRPDQEASASLKNARPIPKQSIEARNVHLMNRDPKSIFNLLRNPRESEGPAYPQSLEYSETERVASQKVSNLWRESQGDPARLGEGRVGGKKEFPAIDAMFENKEGHMMPKRKSDFLERIRNLQREADQQKMERDPVDSSKNVFVNTDHLQVQKSHFMDQLLGPDSKDQPEQVHLRHAPDENPQVEIRQAESFYEVDTSNRYVFIRRF